MGALSATEGGITIEIKQIKMDNDFNDLFNDDDMDIIEWIVECILGHSKELIHGKVRILDSNLKRLAKNDKRKFVDLLIEYNGERLLIELNNNFSGNFIRNILYAINLIYRSYFRKDYYSIIHKLTLVNLNWHSSKEKANKNDKLNEDIIYANEDKNILFKKIDVNLDFYDKLSYNDVTKSEQFYKLLTVKSRKELNYFKNSDRRLANYVKSVLELSDGGKKMDWNKEIDDYFYNQNLYNAGVDRGLEQGLEQGIASNQRDMIWGLNENHVSLDVIAKSAKLTISEVKEIINEQKKVFAK